MYTTMRKDTVQHAVALLFIFIVAILVNGAPYFLTGISLAYRQSSDATVHVVDWQQFSRGYTGQYENDVMFQNYQAQSTGVLFADKALVRVGEFLNLGILTWSIVVSCLSLVLFLSGVYFLVLFSLKNWILALVISLVSIIPVISLGLSSWGFLTGGFVPKELSLGIAVWLTILYLWGASTSSRSKVATFFLLLGLFSNFYPVLFFHYALIIIIAEVLRSRSVKMEQFVYGILFLAMAPIALFDIFIKSSNFTPPDIAIIVDHYTATLHSWKYLFLHYLRKQILYVAIVASLWYVFRRLLKKEYPPLLLLWYAIWWSALGLSLLGVGIELFSPSYMKYLLSRTSVWFYAASMIIVAYTAYEIYFTKFSHSIKNAIFFSAVLFFVLLGQTSVLNVYTCIQTFQKNAEDYKQYLSIVTQLQSVVPPGAVVLSNPDQEANTIRAYGGVASWVSWKDGNVTLFDGDTARVWFERYNKTKEVFAQKDFSAIQQFALENNLSFYLFDTRDIEKGADRLEGRAILESGTYGLVKLK
mgnify:CR=1 FL=1